MHSSDDLTAWSDDSLRTLVDATAGVAGAVLAAADGELVWPRNASPREVRLSRFAWGLCLLADSALDQTGLAPYKHLVVETANGHLVLMPVEHGHRPRVLAVLTKPDAMLGHVLWTVRRCCDVLRKAQTHTEVAEQIDPGAGSIAFDRAWRD